MTGCSALASPEIAAEPAISAITSQKLQVASEQPYVVSVDTTLRMEPKDDAITFSSLPAGARISGTPSEEHPGWVQVRTGEGSGWILEKNLGAGAQTKVSKVPVVYKANQKAALRKTASSTAKSLTSLPKNAFVDQLSLSKDEKWVKSKVNSKTGWLKRSNLTKQSHVKYELKSKQKLQASAGKGATVATVSKGSQVTFTGRSSGANYQVVHGSNMGWVASSQLTRKIIAVYAVKSYTTAHSSPGSKPSGSLFKGQTLGATSVETKKYKAQSWTKIRVGTADRWVLSNKISKVSSNTKVSTPTAIIGKYKSKVSAWTYSAPNGKTASRVVAGFVIGTTSKDTVSLAGKTWIHVKAGSSNVWIDSSAWNTTSATSVLGAPKPVTVAPVDLSSMTKKDWTDTQYVAAIKKNISKYCPSSAVRVTKDGRYYASSHPREIVISRYENPNPNWPDMRSVSLHECAHLLQFDAYKGRLGDLNRDMDPLWGVPKMGIEHLADCMSDLMGGSRAGTLPNGWTYWSGYGGTCNSKQNEAAKKILAGKTLS